MISHKVTSLVFAFLQLAAILVGTLCIIYGGLVGLVGVWVDGPVPIHVRLLGTGVFCYGLLYCAPVWLVKSKPLLLTYAGATVIPSIVLLIAVTWNVRQATISDVVVAIVVFIPATCVLFANAIFRVLAVENPFS